MKDACCGPQGLAWSLLVLLQSRGSPNITIPQTNVTTLVGLVSTILSQDRAVEMVPQCPPHTSEHSDSRCRETRHPAECSPQRAPTSPPVSLLPTLPPQPFLRVSRIPEVPHLSVSRFFMLNPLFNSTVILIKKKNTWFLPSKSLNPQCFISWNPQVLLKKLDSSRLWAHFPATSRVARRAAPQRPPRPRGSPRPAACRGRRRGASTRRRRSRRTPLADAKIWK